MVTLDKKPTARQLMALDAWIDGGRKSKAKALRKAGYGQSIIDQPHKVFSSPVVINELELRGYDFRGIRTEVQASTIYGEEQPIIQFNLTELTLKQIDELKDKLARIPDISARIEKEEYVDLSYSPMGRGLDIFSEEGKYNSENLSIKNYSSM